MSGIPFIYDSLSQSPVCGSIEKTEHGYSLAVVSSGAVRHQELAIIVAKVEIAFSLNTHRVMVWEFIRSNPVALSQIALSFALVVATGVYTYYTMKQTDEMGKTRKMENQPVVKGGIIAPYPVHLYVVVQNTGNAVAHNVYAKMYFDDIDEEPEEFRTSILSPDEKYEFGFPLSDEDTFITGMGRIENIIQENDSEGILTVETTCENPFGEEYSYEERIDVLKIKDNLSQIIRKSEEEKIRKAVEDIESNLSDIENQLNQTYTDELHRDELYEKAREIIRKEGAIEYTELKSRFGVKDRTMSNIVYKLKQNGVVQYPDDVHPLMNSGFRIEHIEEIGRLEETK